MPVEQLKPNINPNPARGMFGGPLGAIMVNPTIIGGVNPTARKIRSALSVKLVERLVTDVTAVRSLDRAERAILGVIIAGRGFGQSRSYLWSLSHFVV